MIGIGVIQTVFGINTATANVITGLVIAVTLALIVAFLFREDRLDEWLLNVIVLKPWVLTQKKISSWKINWQIRSQNPDRKTPAENLSGVLLSVTRQLTDGMGQITSSLYTRLQTATVNNGLADSDEESASTTDEELTSTTDDNTKGSNE